eukprot:TRINITY_DN28417_c0_g1_i2.p2 TRINITY_DN28417_c0_g1~~TRINITY_DN28417_c0_g1_i2.p2  ORF type:complete len:122 (+),score=2.46 TRINITY_DN28417_c0_g1_i2:413-778(+)
MKTFLKLVETFRFPVISKCSNFKLPKEFVAVMCTIQGNQTRVITVFDKRGIKHQSSLKPRFINPEDFVHRSSNTKYDGSKLRVKEPPKHVVFSAKIIEIVNFFCSSLGLKYKKVLLFRTSP